MKKIIFFGCFLVASLAMSAQPIADNEYKQASPKENLPFSRLGLGYINPQYMNPSGAMGGLTAAYRDVSAFNPYNPASLTSLRNAVFEVGLFAKNNQGKNGTQTANTWNGNLSYLGLAFPNYNAASEIYNRKQRKVRWAMGFSLLPYSSVGYNVTTSEKASNTDSVTITSYYVGTGSTYKLQWSNAVEYKGVSLGANVGYLFGKTNDIRQLQMSGVANTYANYLNADYSVRGLTWNVGAQWDIVLDPKSKVGPQGGKKHLILGAYGNTATDFTTESNTTFRRFGNYTDSVTSTSGVVGSGRLPTEFTVGATYMKGQNLKVGVEYKKGMWHEYLNTARPASLLDTREFAAGAEFSFNQNKLKNPYERVRWRVGYRNMTDARMYQGEQLKTSIVSVGTSLPFVIRAGLASYMSVGLSYEKTAAKSVSENVYRITLGFSLNDNTWFQKAKFF